MQIRAEKDGKHLTERKDKQKWEKSDEIKGGGYAKGKSAVTQDIWMWMYPHLVNDVRTLHMFQCGLLFAN